MTCSCFTSDSPKKLRKTKKPKKRGTVFHWPNFTWTHSEDNLRYRHHHHSRFFFFHLPYLHRDRNTEEQIIDWERYKASQVRPALSRHNTVDQAQLEYLVFRQPRVHFEVESNSSQSFDREPSLFPAACITPTRSDVLTSRDRNSHYLIQTRSVLHQVRPLRITNQQVITRSKHSHHRQDRLLHIGKQPLRVTNSCPHRDRRLLGRVRRMTIQL